MNARAVDPRHALLGQLQRLHALRPLDAEIGRFVLELDGEADPALGLAAAAASLAVAQGHSCLPLAQLADVLAEAAPAGAQLPELPDAAAVRGALRGSRLVGDGSTEARTPLVLDAQERLYLRRYFRYESGVAAALRARLATTAAPAPDAAALRVLLERHFTLAGGPIDWQALAVLTGLLSPLTVITGGPGTGKTSSVLWLLTACVEQALQRGAALPRIRLAAPTGKAAARLGESLRERVARLDCSDAVRAAIPVEASTLHRLLGTIPHSTRFRLHREHPLDVDLVVVDEASMVDLPLMARLLDALPAQARLVLLGDRDQLASVEAGNVLAGICAAAGEGGVSPPRAAIVRAVTGFEIPVDATAMPFADAVIELRHSHRFGSDTGLGQLAAVIRAGDAAAAIAGLHAGAFGGIELDAATGDPSARIVERYGDFFAALAGYADPVAALQEAARVRVLTALREGPSGCVTLNAALEHRLRQRAGVGAGEAWYPGRLVLVIENDYGTELFNGDIGIALPDADGHLLAWFPAGAGGVRSLPLQALPAHESACAMTIHKSQGSEFDEVMIVLPADDARVLGRELLYTAVTRARSAVRLLAGDEALRRTIGRSTRRHSGLADRLRATGPTPHPV
jgi:exodeoxyribonuclease V alpha subunit